MSVRFQKIFLVLESTLTLRRNANAFPVHHDGHIGRGRHAPWSLHHCRSTNPWWRHFGASWSSSAPQFGPDSDGYSAWYSTRCRNHRSTDRNPTDRRRSSRSSPARWSDIIDDSPLVPATVSEHHFSLTNGFQALPRWSRRPWAEDPQHRRTDWPHAAYRWCSTYPPLPVLPHSEPNAPPSTATNPACATPGCIDIDALIKKVSRSLREDFLHLPATADPPDDDATRCRSLDPAEATPDPTAPAPTSRHAPTICYQLSDTPHHLQSALHPVVHTGPTTIAPLTRPPAKPPDPTASQPSVPKHFQQPSNHRKHQITPPGPLAPPPKRTRITSYFRPLYGGSVSPSPSIPLPPFNPVLMDTPDKYTQHNFRPP